MIGNDGFRYDVQRNIALAVQKANTHVWQLGLDLMVALSSFV